jgi:hypothetical protein
MKDRFNRADYRFLAVCVVLLAATAWFSVRNFYRAFPEASIDFRVSRADGQTLAAVAVALGREDLVMARRLEHGLVAGQDPVAPVRLGPRDGSLLPQRAVGPDRVRGVLVGVVVEVDHRATAGLCHRCSPLAGFPIK